MKKLLVVGVIILFVVMSISSSTGFNLEKKSTIPLNGKTLYVGGSGPNNYTKIQDAIDDSSDGDTVFVYNGTYNENVVVNKSIHLIGEDRNITIIDGEGSGYVVRIDADWVNLSSFTIQNSHDFRSGVELVYEENCTIFNNNICSNYVGIHMVESRGTVIKGNYISNNTEDGIELMVYWDDIVTDNIITNNKNGIYLVNGGGYNYTIIGNIISSNKERGIWIKAQRGETYVIGNIITNNKCGIYAEWGSNNINHNNIIDNNCGIFISYSLNIIEKNNFIENKIHSKFEWPFLKGIHPVREIHTWLQGKVYEGMKNERDRYNNNFRTLVFMMNQNQKPIMWNRNYWGRPRIYPYSIFGKIGLIYCIIPWINFDWHPAQEPYDIEV